MRVAHDMPFGARVHAGGVDFRLWAPAARSAQVVLTDAGSSHPATPSGGGWWTCTVAGLGSGTHYRWRIDDEREVPDPASRFNPEGPHGPSRVVDPASFSWDEGWHGRPWAETVLYELHVGTFTPEGTFATAAARLPELVETGITAIELMPVASFGGQFGWGYDGVLPFAPHAAYGTPDDLKALVQAAHRLGLSVLLDVVYNHFGPDGNYLAGYAPAFFSADASSPWGPALNFDGADSVTVRDFFVHNAIYWLQEYRLDGLRIDAVHAIVDRGERHLMQELSERVRAAVPERQIHLVLENEHNAYRMLGTPGTPGRFEGQWNDDFHHVLHVAITGETHGYYHDYGTDPIDLLARAFTHGMVFEGSERLPGGARRDVRPTPAQPLGALVNFAHNHDQIGNRARGERLSELVPPQAALLPTLLALLTPAIPMLFQGEEWGAPQPFLYFADWQGELRDAVRAGRRREFGHVEAHDLPDPCSRETFEASRPGPAPSRTEWRQQVRGALEARRRWLTPRLAQLATGEHTAQRVAERALAVRWRYSDGHALHLDLNLSGEELSLDSHASGAGEGLPVFEHRWPQDTPPGRWPAWSARWRLTQEAA